MQQYLANKPKKTLRCRYDQQRYYCLESGGFATPGHRLALGWFKKDTCVELHIHEGRDSTGQAWTLRKVSRKQLRTGSSSSSSAVPRLSCGISIPVRMKLVEAVETLLKTA